MTAPLRKQLGRGPLRADALPPGAPYELSEGHPILCAPAGGRHGRGNLVGASVLDTDPLVTSAGVDVGFTPDEGTIRAPDVSVGDVPDTPHWAPGAPPLAVEYADQGQDEAELMTKIAELLAAGTRFVWVVRLTGARRVEVHAPGEPLRSVAVGEVLLAPGILRNAVPVEALFDREAAHRATFHNLLQREGYESLEQVREQGRGQGREEGRAQGREEGRAHGREEGQADLLARLFADRLRRALTADERASLRTRLSALGADRLSNVVLQLAPDPLAAWLADDAAT